MNPREQIPAITVVTATFNGSQVIGRQLDALAAQDAPFAWEYVVVDNGSTDGTLEMIRERVATFPVPLRIIDGSARRSIPFVRNLGAKAARAAELVFCDQDDIVQPGWLRTAHESLITHEACMGRILALDGPRAGEVMNPSVATSMPIVESCNFAIRRDLLMDLGGFDEDLPPYGGEDSEFALRLRTRGHRIEGVPDMVIRAQQTHGAKNRIVKAYRSGQSQIHIWRKYPALFEGRLRWSSVAGSFGSSLVSLVAPSRTGTPRARAMRGAVTSIGNASALISSAWATLWMKNPTSSQVHSPVGTHEEL